MVLMMLLHLVLVLVALLADCTTKGVLAFVLGAQVALQGLRRSKALGALGASQVQAGLVLETMLAEPGFELEGLVTIGAGIYRHFL